VIAVFALAATGTNSPVMSSPHVGEVMPSMAAFSRG
jgi:hypothetical protein